MGDWLATIGVMSFGAVLATLGFTLLARLERRVAREREDSARAASDKAERHA